MYPRRQDDVVWKVIDGKGILLNLEDGSYFEVNPVGLAIWQKSDGRSTYEEIARLISKDFRTTPQRVEKDLTPFVAELKRRKLVAVSPTPAAEAARSLAE